MKPPRNVQIPWELFVSLLRYVEVGEGSREQLAAALEAKMQRILARDAYSRAHNSLLSAEERAEAVQEYLRAVDPQNYKL